MGKSIVEAHSKSSRKSTSASNNVDVTDRQLAEKYAADVYSKASVKLYADSEGVRDVVIKCEDSGEDFALAIARTDLPGRVKKDSKSKQSGENMLSGLSRNLAPLTRGQEKSLYKLVSGITSHKAAAQSEAWNSDSTQNKLHTIFNWKPRVGNVQPKWTVKFLKAELDGLGVEYEPKSTLSVLKSLYRDATEKAT